MPIWIKDIYMWFSFFQLRFEELTYEEKGKGIRILHYVKNRNVPPIQELVDKQQTGYKK